MENKKFIKLLMLIGVVLFANQLFAAGVVSPMEMVKNVAIDQGKENVFPVAIIWILGLTAIISGIAGKAYPFVIGVFASAVLAFAPDLATSYTHFDFKTLSDGTTMQVK